uniref:alpha/beta hydrolase n=1 Tax=Streptomyces albidus (ex Kaewkla and Franco 2022) TaxID=722709 RepID=UPI0015EFC87F
MRRLPLTTLTCLMLLLCTSLVAGGGSDRDPEAKRTYSYGSGPRQQLVAFRDRTRPLEGGVRRPAVVVLHGGFWFQDRSSGWDAWAQRIADSGATVFDVDYRRNVDASWPAQRSDVLRALHWIRHRSGAFGVDPQRIVLLGSSAGGQLATSVGTYGAGRQHVAGVIG